MMRRTLGPVVLVFSLVISAGSLSAQQPASPLPASPLLEPPAFSSSPVTGLCCPDALARFRSDHAFDDFISPITNPAWFEDPRSLTELRPIFINQQIPEGSPLAGGDFQVFGLQARLALSDRLSLIATKSGFITLQADSLPDDDGWADLATGFKYVFLRDECNRFLLSGGLVHEWSQGSRDVFQGNGDGMWNLFMSAGKGFGRAHILGTAGWHVPVDGAENSESLFYSLHLDYELCQGFYPVLEFNGFHYTESGSRLPLNVEGGDLINLGSSDVAGNYFATLAVGATKVFSPHFSASAAWEFPVTGREDLFDNRLTMNLILRY